VLGAQLERTVGLAGAVRALPGAVRSLASTGGPQLLLLLFGMATLLFGGGILLRTRRRTHAG
jgi:LPXTG-motif cell wall-anchored protein